MSSDEAVAVRAQGNEQFKAKAYDEAIALYTQAIELDPNGENAALCLSNRSAAHQGKKMWAEAAADAAQCIALKPDFVKGYTRLANAQKKRGLLTEGIEVRGEDARRSAGVRRGHMVFAAREW